PQPGNALTLIQLLAQRLHSTAEVDLSELVYGPLSEFNCANQFVLTGFAPPEFRVAAARYLAALGLRFEELEEEVLQRLYARTGDNTYFLRLILCSAFDRRASAGGWPVSYWLLRGQELPGGLSGFPELGRLIDEMERQSPPRTPLDEDDLDRGIE